MASTGAIVKKSNSTAEWCRVRPEAPLTPLGIVKLMVALPFALFSKSVAKTGDVLVGKPARATFTRPLGDFNQIGD